MPSLSLRLGETLYSRFQGYWQSFAGGMTKSQTVQYLLIRYLERPKPYSVLEVRELREPMVFSVTAGIPDKLWNRLSELAGDRQLNRSEVLRMAIYQELIVYENQV